jgi:GAF domain-containing protein
MMLVSPPIPENESARLRVLYQYEILDTISEEAFDELTELAAIICNTPIALITLVDKDRQWFKSVIGMSGRETPRDVAFCAHTIMGADVMIVPDATRDKRFASNPLVTSDPHIRFYAGAPLLSPGGYGLGSLCVIDRVPRTLAPEQKKALEILGRQVMTHFKLHRTLQNLSRLQARQGGALQPA